MITCDYCSSRIFDTDKQCNHCGAPARTVSRNKPVDEYLSDIYGASLSSYGGGGGGTLCTSGSVMANDSMFSARYISVDNYGHVRFV